MRCAVFGPAQCLRILTLPPFPAKPPASGKGAVASGRNGGAATTVVDWVDWLSVGSALKLVYSAAAGGLAFLLPLWVAAAVVAAAVVAAVAAAADARAAGGAGGAAAG